MFHPDVYKHHADSLHTPAVGGQAVVPYTPFEYLSRALYCGGSGHIVVCTERGDTLTFRGVPEGAILPIRNSEVVAAGTTATNLLALW